MANNTDYADVSEMDELNFDPRRLAYIKQTDLAEARAQGIVPEGISLPPDIKFYVLHAVDGSVLGYTDAYDSAYGAAVQNELTPVSVH